MSSTAKLGSLQPLTLLTPILNLPRLHLEVIHLLTQIRHVFRRERLSIPDRRQGHQHLIHVHVSLGIPAPVGSFLLSDELVVSQRLGICSHPISLVFIQLRPWWPIETRSYLRRLTVVSLERGIDRLGRSFGIDQDVLYFLLVGMRYLRLWNRMVGQVEGSFVYNREDRSATRSARTDIIGFRGYIPYCKDRMTSRQSNLLDTFTLRLVTRPIGLFLPGGGSTSILRLGSCQGVCRSERGAA